MNNTNSKYSFRYFGGINTSEENAGSASLANDGVITVASHLVDGVIYCGVSLTPPGIKFDKTFSRAIAQYRLDTCLGVNQAQALADLGVALDSVRNRVYKQVTRERITPAEYARLRAENPGSEAAHANLGYYRTTRERFNVEDFAVKFVDGSNVIDSKDLKYLFMCRISHNTHSAIDLDILNVMIDLEYPAWAFDIIASTIDEIDSNLPEGYDEDLIEDDTSDDSDSDDESSEDEIECDFTLEDLSAAFDNIGIVKRTEGVALFSIPVDGDVAEQHDAALEMQHYLTPVFANKDCLADWLTDLAHKVRSEGLSAFDMTHG